MNDGRMQWVLEGSSFGKMAKRLGSLRSKDPALRRMTRREHSMAWIKPLPEKLGIATKAPLCLTAVTSQ